MTSIFKYYNLKDELIKYRNNLSVIEVCLKIGIIAYHPHGSKVAHSTCVKSTCLIALINLNGVNSMLLTYNLIKFNNFFVKIPEQTNRVWDTSENRWGFKHLKK